MYAVPHRMDGPCPRLQTGDPPCGHPCPHGLFQPLPPQPAPLPGIYINTVPGAKGMYLTAGDTLSQAIPLDQIHHMAMAPQLPDTNKPETPSGRTRGAGSPAPGPRRHGPRYDAAAPHHETQGPAPSDPGGGKALHCGRSYGPRHRSGSQHLGGVMGTRDDDVGHPTERKDRVQEREDSLAPGLMDHLVQLTSPPEQYVQKGCAEDHGLDGPRRTPGLP